MNECERHKTRKRKDCADCFPENLQTDLVDSDTIPITKHLADLPVLADVIEPVITESQSKYYDAKAIRVMIEAEIHKAVAKVRSEMADMMKVTWEHLYIPYNSFSLELMGALEKDGWKYCDMIKNARQFGYFADGDIFLVQRIQKKDNNLAPDFTKSGAIKRYIDKYNGRANITP